jgi:LuxR family transcriptional regulator, activator of conjugal transfer of Ti plasmids
MPIQVLFDDFIEACHVASDRQMLRKSLFRLARACGFDQFTYLNIQAKKAHVETNYPLEWRHRYFKMAYMSIDPVVVRAMRHKQKPFDWSIDDLRRSAEGIHRRFCNEAAERGIRSGISMPIGVGFGSYAIVTLASSNAQADLTVDMIDPVRASALLGVIHTTFTRLGDQPLERGRFSLSERQLLCLRWLSEGKTGVEIADILGTSERTVRFHIETAKKALEAVTTPQATATAVRLNLI